MSAPGTLDPHAGGSEVHDDERTAGSGAEEALRASEARLRSLEEHVPSTLTRYDRQLRIVSVNRQAEEVMGVPASRFPGRTNRELGIPEALCALWDEAIASVFRTGETRELEFDFPSPAGPRSFFLRLAAEKAADGSFEHVLGVSTEITGRKQAEANQALLAEVLRILNRGDGLESAIRDSLQAIQRVTGFDAVELRMRGADDYPCLEQDDLSNQARGHPSPVDGTRPGGLDAGGRALPECACSLVLSGRADPLMSCFTASGSFWTNRSQDLLALPRGDDPRVNLRTPCIHAGCQSVGLFPVRSAEEIIGLLQVNDHREGRFTPELIAFLESLAQNIGLCLRRTAAEAALRASEERFRGLVEQAVDGIFVADARGQYIDVNAAGAAMLGYTPAEVCRLTIADVLSPEEIARIPEQMSQLASGAIVRNEWQFRRKDGSTFTGELVGRQLPEGQLQGILRDVTERRLAETALRESEERFRALTQNLVSAVALINEGGEFSIVNRSFLRMFDLDEQADILNVNSQDWSRWRVFDENGSLLGVDEHPVRKAALTRTPVKDTLVAVQSPVSADPKWLLVSAEPILDERGTLLRLICTYHDITARKRAEEALQQANAALAEADRRKDEFIAILSHELRNPLAPIRYALPVLGAQPLDEAGVRALSVVGRQVDHLVRLVDDLLDVSRITRGKIELRREHVTLGSVVSAAAEAASPAITAGRHTLRMDVPDEPVWLYADPARIAQVVNNLLDNSAKYTPKGGEIRLQAEREAGGVVIRVRDNGRGIPADALPAVFEMFRQVGRPGASEGGLGIGLALVKLLVEMHGGTIEARSAGVGQGAEFTVWLPVPDQVAVQSEDAAPLREAGRRLRVLVVDDNADLAEMLGIAVESAGHEVRKALDGPSGVSAALSFRPDVVLLDIGLPGMSGIEVAKALRRMPEMAGVCLVALTGWGQAEDRRQTREAGFDHHLTKPTEPDTVLQLLAGIASDALARQDRANDAWAPRRSPRKSPD